MENEVACNLIDENGDNRAVQLFLAMYGNEDDVSIARMQLHLERYGFGCYLPDWVETEKGVLTITRAREWIRHLFLLEKAEALKTKGRT